VPSLLLGEREGAKNHPRTEKEGKKKWKVPFEVREGAPWDARPQWGKSGGRPKTARCWKRK